MASWAAPFSFDGSGALLVTGTPVTPVTWQSGFQFDANGYLVVSVSGVPSTIPDGTILGNTSGSTAAPSAINALGLSATTTGSVASGLSTNQITVADSSNPGNGNATMGFALRDNVGGTGSNGTKIGFATFTNLISAAGTDAQMVGIWGVAEQKSALTTASFTAMNPQVIVDANDTVNGATGVEADVSVRTGGHATTKIGIGIVSSGDDAVHASSRDAGLAFWAGSAGVGFNNGILFSNLGGGQPVPTTGTLMNTEGAYTYASGIDLSNSTFTSNAFKSTGFTVDGTGKVGGAGFAVTTDPGSSVGNQYTGFGSGVVISGATFSTGFGYKTLNAQTSSNSNTAFGYESLLKVVTGNTNTAVGAFALANSTTSGGSALGFNAGLSFTGAGAIDAFGFNALEFDTSGVRNSAFGSNALTGITGTPITGSDNAAFGNSSLKNCQGGCGSNVAIGSQTGVALTTGTNNTLIGSYVANGTLTTGGGNVLIGAGTSCTTAASGTSNTIGICGTSTAVWSATGTNTPSTSATTIAGNLTVASGIISAGTKFTAAGTGCTVGTTTGGATAGTFTLAAGPCTSVAITMNGATGVTAPNGWTCQAHDRTAPTVLIGGESSSTTTTATITIPAGAGATDVISFSCTGY